MFGLLWSVKEVERMRKIVRGVAMVQAKYPGSVFLSLLTGVLRGNGTSLIRPAVRLMSGLAGLDNELTKPGLSTKVILFLKQSPPSLTTSLVVYRGCHGLDLDGGHDCR